MAHLVAPVAYRAGKTYPWHHNVILGTKSRLIGGGLTLAAGIENVTRSLLRRKRLYVVRGGIAASTAGRLEYKLLFIPRVKIRPREYSVGNFIRSAIYKPADLYTNGRKFKTYADLRKDKAARMRRKVSPKKLNRWLSRRLFRGADRRTLRRGARPLLSTIESHGKAFSNTLLTKLQSGKALPSSRTATLRLGLQYYKRVDRRQKWKYDKVALRRFNSRKFSNILSRLLHGPIRVDCANFFSYVVQKRVLNFKNHQNHFWNFRYRRYRFQYKNYFDLLNSFLCLVLVDNTEGFFLSILKITLPLILKIRKFFKFLAVVIRYMSEIEEKFAVFKLSIAGKLAGGTKRTKFHSIGFGVLPVQSLTVHASNKFMAYTHIYGEFGLRLLLCKNISPQQGELRA